MKHTVELTRNELEILDAAFEVLSDGDMAYVVLRLPEIIAAHRTLYTKFHEALTSASTWWKLEPDEHMPTLEGVIEYLETQNDTAFLAYRRLERGSEPGMDATVRKFLTEWAYTVWQGTGDARNLAQEKAKPVLVPTREPNLKALDKLALDRFSRPFVELDVDHRAEIREEYDNDPLPHTMPDGETTQERAARQMEGLLQQEIPGRHRGSTQVQVS